ncbi:MAG: N-acetylmuramoyl-L-alanine amidase [Terriglobales bacterium]
MRAPRRAGLLLALAVLWLAGDVSRSLEEKRVSVYAPQTSYRLAVLERDKKDYVGLLDLLEPLGAASATSAGAEWTIRWNTIEARFTEGKTKGKIRGNKVDLAAPLLVENGRPLVPLHSLATLLSRFLDARVDVHESARRVFVGNAGARFTTELKKTEPPALVLNFSMPVSPAISTEGGRLKMVFARDPVISATENFSFDDKTISTMAYDESSGSAELTVSGAAPLLASFSNGGRTITVSVAPAQPAHAQTAPVPATVGETPAPPSPLAAVAPGQPRPAAAEFPRSRYLVIVDASHGGEERGADLSNDLVEKDVTLTFARRIRAELQNRGITTAMVRDADTALALQQRAEMANASHAAVFLTIHAGTMGSGVRVYTSMLPPSAAATVVFLPWETAQARYVNSSRTVADSIALELGRRRIPSESLTAPVRPLNNVAAAAVAIEVNAPAADLRAFHSPNYQLTVASAVAAAVAAARARLEEPR